MPRRGSAHSTSAANHPEGSKKKEITDTMDLVLERSDLFQVGTVSHRHTLALVSGAKSGRARVVVGDDHGETPGREPNFAGRRRETRVLRAPRGA